MPTASKKKGIVYFSDRPAMSRDQYQAFRSDCEKKGESTWPSYDDLIDLEPEADSDPSPSS